MQSNFSQKFKFNLNWLIVGIIEWLQMSYHYCNSLNHPLMTTKRCYCFLLLFPSACQLHSVHMPLEKTKQQSAKGKGAKKRGLNTNGACKLSPNKKNWVDRTAHPTQLVRYATSHVVMYLEPVLCVGIADTFVCVCVWVGVNAKQ